MRIAITGARGTLGRACVQEALGRGHHVVAIDLSLPAGGTEDDERVTPLTMDLGDAEALRTAVDGADALIHLAARVSPRRDAPYAVHNTNVTASYNALWAAASAGIDRVCLASSVNAIGGVFSAEPRFDYFPLDEAHPSYAEDPYSLSKWVLEEQARSVARRHRSMWIASLRFHALRDESSVRERYREDPALAARDLWGYSPLPDSARACLDVLQVDTTGAEVFYVVAAESAGDRPSDDLRREYYPDVPLRASLDGTASFFDSSKARKWFGWDVR